MLTPGRKADRHAVIPAAYRVLHNKKNGFILYGLIGYIIVIDAPFASFDVLF